MRKKVLLYLMLMIGAFVCADHSSFAQCKAKQIMKACRPNIKPPLKYDSYAINDFKFDDTEKKVEVQFTAFKGVKYKIVFCTSGFEEPLKVDIYDKSNKIKKNRNKVYDTSNGIDNNFWSFEPPKFGNYFIEYTVPKSLKPGVVTEGCVILLIAYYEEGAKN